MGLRGGAPALSGLGKPAPKGPCEEERGGPSGESSQDSTSLVGGGILVGGGLLPLGSAEPSLVEGLRLAPPLPSSYIY